MVIFKIHIGVTYYNFETSSAHSFDVSIYPRNVWFKHIQNESLHLSEIIVKEDKWFVSMVFYAWFFDTAVKSIYRLVRPISENKTCV